MRANTSGAFAVFIGICLRQLVVPSLARMHADLRVYVYDLPSHLAEDILTGQYQQPWLFTTGYEYEAEIWVYHEMVNGPWRVSDPELANIFYIPVLPTKLLHQALSPTIDWHEAMRLSGKYLEEAFEHVQRLPYWARKNGRDHLIAMTADSGRCTHLREVPRSLWGQLRVVLHLGDLLMQDELQGIPCFDPDSDILMPSYNPVQREPVTSVHLHVRNITVLYRFDTTGHTAAFPYHTKLIRPELYKQHEANPVPGSSWAAGSINQTMDDMTNSIFCVCPPGVVAHTSRFWRALRRGCIPVTFFRAYQLPFSDVIDYSKATVNIQPYNIHTLHQTITNILNNKARLQALQQEVDRIQKLLLWEGGQGIHTLYANELSRRVAKY